MSRSVSAPEITAFAGLAASGPVRVSPRVAFETPTSKPLFYDAMLDSLPHQIAAIDHAGTIVYVNAAWIAFGRVNGMGDDFEWLGVSYVNVCAIHGESADFQIRATGEGIRRVIAGESDAFEAEYPCHGPTERRWFMMRIARLTHPGSRLCVVSHINITARKIAEEAMEALSVTDSLTGLANRRRLDVFLADEWRRALRQRTLLSLIVFDADNFKLLNDTAGHAAGDTCLQAIGKILIQFTKRPTDLAARFGGEEFVVVLADTKVDDALVVANLIRDAVYGLNLRFGDGRRLTVSAGVSCLRPDRDGTGACLVEQADQALYRAKRNGRNRVERSEDADRGDRHAANPRTLKEAFQ